MTQIKNKLAESVRQAKNTQAAAPSRKAASKLSAAPRGPKAGAAPSRKPVRAAPKAPAPATTTADANRAAPQTTANVLFPMRVWPD